MLDSKEFDLWADDYEMTVRMWEDAGAYPFAGYRKLHNEIYNRLLPAAEKNVLDVGFGTGTLCAGLYEQGCHIFGQDFSKRMIQLAQNKMPEAKLYYGDISLGLVDALKTNRYDAVIATYCLHHLTDRQKVDFLTSLLPLLRGNGCILIGDIAFATRGEMEKCRAETGEKWDDDEHYFVFEEMKAFFPGMTFEKVSPCAGLLTIPKTGGL